VDELLRPAELAGSHYPADAEACRAALEGWPALDGPGESAVGAVVPHGGWRYAGRLIAGGLKALQKARPGADLVVLLGGHVEKGEPPRIFIEGGWETPLGPVPTPVPLAEALAMVLSAEPETAEEYYDDNAVEVLMPAIRHLYPDVPCLVLGPPPDVDPGNAAREIFGEARDRGFREPLVIGSCDLTHYGPDHGFRPRGSGPGAHAWATEENDASLVARLEALDAHRIVWEGPRNRSTCSAGAGAVAVALAKLLGASRGHCLARSSSWVEAGRPADMRSFVGYATLLLA
jgi:hypothetical protein